MIITRDQPDVTLITPTGSRPEAFALCERWMQRQTFAGRAQWIVVSDEPDGQGGIVNPCTLGQTFVGRHPQPDDPQHTLARNLLAALPLVRNDQLLFIEDDDYYGPAYIETMLGWLAQADLVGEAGAKYYHLGQNAYRHFKRHDHASLCRTGMTRAAYGQLRESVLRCDAKRTPSVDLHLWKHWRGSRFAWRDDRGDARLCVGIKGGPGRRSRLHDRHDYQPDPDLRILKQWVGPDWEAYVELARRPVVYTAIFGGYDALRPPRVVDPGVDYVCFSDDPLDGGGVWDVRVVKRRQDTLARENRYYKLHPHMLFPDAPWSLYVDGNLVLKQAPTDMLANLQRRHGRHDIYIPSNPLHICAYQELAWVVCEGFRDSDRLPATAARYEVEGFPRDAGCVQANFILRRHTPGVAAFDACWWNEIKTGCHRDQVSCTYAAWKTAVDLCIFPRRERFQFAMSRPHRRPRDTPLATQSVSPCGSHLNP